MKTWVLISIILVVFATVGTAIAMTILFVRKRAKARAEENYSKSIVNEALLAQNLETQAAVITDVEAAANDANAAVGNDQDLAFGELAQSKKDLEELQKNLAAATVTTNTLKNEKNAVANAAKADKALEVSKKDLSFVKSTRDKIKNATATGIQTITKSLQDQQQVLKEFRASLQKKAMVMAQEVNNPAITPPVLTDKPSVRTIWDAAVQLVVTAPNPDVAIKQLAELYQVIQKDAADLKKAADDYKNPKVCEKIMRVQLDGKIGCPDGFTDTGRNLGDVDGEVQCVRGPCPALNPNKCGYTRRVEKFGRYECPIGYKDTGRPDVSDYQCQIGPCGAIPDDCQFSKKINGQCPSGMVTTDWVGDENYFCRTQACKMPPKPPVCQFSKKINGQCPSGMVTTDWVGDENYFCRTPACKMPPKPPACQFSKKINGQCPSGMVTTDWVGDANYFCRTPACKMPPKPAPAPAPGPAPSGGCPSGGWMDAQGTVFSSYPRPGSREAIDNSGAQWEGLFAYANGKQSREWVASQNIVAVFNSRDGRNDGEMKKKYAGRTLWVKNKSNGTCMQVKVLDTCADSDCSGCCTRNANAGGGMLIDFEVNTAKRFFGSGYREEGGEPANFERILWQFA